MAVKREDGQVLIEKIVYHLVFIFQTFAILNNHYDFCHFIHTFSFASSFLNIISEVTATVGLCVSISLDFGQPEEQTPYSSIVSIVAGKIVLVIILTMLLARPKSGCKI